MSRKRFEVIEKKLEDYRGFEVVTSSTFVKLEKRTNVRWLNPRREVVVVGSGTKLFR